MADVPAPIDHLIKVPAKRPAPKQLDAEAPPAIRVKTEYVLTNHFMLAGTAELDGVLALSEKILADGGFEDKKAWWNQDKTKKAAAEAEVRCAALLTTHASQHTYFGGQLLQRSDVVNDQMQATKILGYKWRSMH
jgi:hypothetical protein